jgi:rhodanese-related sulfurtransferase
MITKGIKQLIAEAEKRAEGISVAEAQARLDDADTVFVDLRDVRELERDGMIPGAFHAPRGMLEFWVDPESPYHKPIFAEDRKFVFFCAGGWRSLLAAQTAQQMGLKPVAHLTDGFSGWKKAGAPVEEPVEKPKA